MEKYLHPKTKEPIHESAPGDTVGDSAIDALEKGLDYLLHNGRVFNAVTEQNTGLLIEDLVPSEHEILRLKGPAFEWYQKISKNDSETDWYPGFEIKTRVNLETGIVGFSVSCGLSGKRGDFISSILGTGKTPQEALESFKKDFESYKAFKKYSTYYILAYDQFIEIAEETAHSLTREDS